MLVRLLYKGLIKNTRLSLKWWMSFFELNEVRENSLRRNNRLKEGFLQQTDEIQYIFY